MITDGENLSVFQGETTYFILLANVSINHFLANVTLQKCLTIRKEKCKLILNYQHKRLRQIYWHLEDKHAGFTDVSFEVVEC